MGASENGNKLAILPGQCRAARALIDLSQDDLVERSGVPKRTLVRFEAGEGVPQRRTAQSLQAALEAAGVDFTNGGEPGVKLRKAAGEPPERAA